MKEQYVSNPEMEDVPDPERNSPSPKPTSSLPTLPFPKGTETLLFVDDDPLIRDMLCDMFQRLGYTVHLASDGLAAIERFQKLQGRVDAVLLDLSMPRMGGVECLKCLQKIAPHLRVLISSGHDLEEESDELRLLGAWGVIQKPYRFNELAQQIRTILDA